MVNQKLKVYAVAFLLMCFIVAGAVLVEEETVSAKSAAEQNGPAIYLYQNPFALDHANAPQPAAKPESRGATASLILWIVGMPLGVFGGLAIGLMIGSQQWKKSSRHPKMQYLHNAGQLDECASVLKSETRVAQQDNVTFDPLSSTVPPCRPRFRSAAPSSRRENQARQIF